MRTATTLFRKVCRDLRDAGIEVHDGLEPTPDLCPRRFAGLLLARNIIRKFEGDAGVTKAASTAAVVKFVSANNHSTGFSTDQLVSTSIDELLVGHFSLSLHRFFDSGLSSGQIHDDSFAHYCEGMPGPGASIATKSTDMLHKMFDSSVSITQGLLPIWELCTTAEQTEPLSNAFFFARERKGIAVVDSSKGCIVPKRDTEGRFIATEPSANMWMQRGFSASLERGLRSYFGIDLSNQQDKNRLLALQGSSHDDLATIDLESASDCIGLHLLQFFPKWVRAILLRYRCPGVILPDGSKMALGMISTMGNGFTFSLMTVIMSCVVDAVASLSGVQLTRWSRGSNCTRVATDSLPTVPGNWGVFGDDIICPRALVPRIFRLLSLLGFKVNESKSFVEGPFKESCGGDYYRGVDVRPVFVKHLETRADLFVAFNALTEWSARHNIHLRSSLCWLVRELGGKEHVKSFYVPLAENMDAGLRVPFSILPVHHRKDVNGALLYNREVVIPSVIWVDRRPKTVRHGRVSRCRNAFGISQTALYGALRGGTASVRQDRTKRQYRAITGKTPNWDYPDRKVGRVCASPGQLMAVLEPVLS